MELPLKIIVRGYSWTVVPITWRGRRSGASKLKIKEMERILRRTLLLAGKLQPRRLRQETPGGRHGGRCRMAQIWTPPSRRRVRRSRGAENSIKPPRFSPALSDYAARLNPAHSTTTGW